MKKHLRRKCQHWCPFLSQSRLQAQLSLNFQMWTHLQLVSQLPQLLGGLWSQVLGGSLCQVPQQRGLPLPNNSN